jgi:chitin disaccharide deacetylase
MRRLVVNADDLGADEGRNQGIFEAIKTGSVTSVSILANGQGLKDALAKIRRLEEARVSLGIHLNLSEGEPLSSGLRLLTGSDGQFLGKAATQRLLVQLGHPDLEREVWKEVDAQIRCLQEAGLTLHHLDGHQHVHVFPAVVRSAMKAAADHGIPWIRIPDEPRPAAGTEHLSAALAEESRLFSGLASEARAFLKAHALRAPDRFFGLYWKGRLATAPLEAMVRRLPDGLSELMVHPGRVMSRPPTGPFSSFSTSERERELEVLLTPGFRTMLAKNGVELTPFPV